VELAFALAVAALWAVTLRPTSLGGPATYVVIRGDSMLPIFHSGDLVVLRVAEGVAPGDVVGYRVPDGEVGAGYLVVHRIAAGDGQSGFTMLGDNNPAPDPWQPRPADIAGKAWVLLPGLGRVIVLVHQPAVAAALAVSLLVMLVLSRSRWPVSVRRPLPAFSPKAVVGTTGAGQASPSHPGP
jgi:signal peptidase I